MARPPAPHPDERARMNVLLGLDVLDTTPEEHFDGLVNLASGLRASTAAAIIYNSYRVR